MVSCVKSNHTAVLSSDAPSEYREFEVSLLAAGPSLQVNAIEFDRFVRNIFHRIHSANAACDDASLRH